MSRLVFQGTTRSTAPKISLGVGATPSLNINRAAADELGLKANDLVMLYLDPAKREIVLGRAGEEDANAVAVRQRNKSSYGGAMSAFFQQFGVKVVAGRPGHMTHKGQPGKDIRVALP